MADKTREEQLAEELEALKQQMETLKADLQKNKDAQSKSSAEAAEYKRKYQEKLTAEEKAKAEAEEEAKKREEAYAELAKRNEELTKNITSANNKAKLSAAGFSKERAENIAKMFDGEIPDAFLTELAGHITDHDKETEKQRVNGTDKPGAGADGGGKVITKEEFLKLPFSKWQEFADKNPELYKEYTS